MLNDAKQISLNAIRACLPDQAVRQALERFKAQGDVYLVSVGKAAYAMAAEACKDISVTKGILITKYGHIAGDLPGIAMYEAGHPLPDENTLKATKQVLELCSDLKKEDTVLFLLSGGASALFEEALIPLDELRDLNAQMLRKGLSIDEINTIRKKLSAVKGGRFARHCEPARVCSIILSDVLGDRLDIIGSGPAVNDESSADDALRIIEEYDLQLSDEALKIISGSRPVVLHHTENHIIGSVRILCQKAMEEAEKLGYHPILIDDQISCEAGKAGDLLMREVRKHLSDKENIALIMGGETLVRVKGNGLGGRNQELVLSQIEALKDMDDVLIMSLGSDGTDGPTDAAGAYADGKSFEKLQEAGIDLQAYLENNDSYHALDRIDALIRTGATGTNVNDLTIALIQKKR